jgi:hypothetical protein
MMARILTALAITLSTAASVDAADFMYSATHGPGCTNIRSRPELTSWRCAGPAGYSALFYDAVSVVGVSFGPTRKEHAIVNDDLAWQAADEAFGDKIEWRMIGRKPYAAILRIWRNDINPQTGDTRAVEELLVIKVSDAGACRVGTVSMDRDANLMARDLADSLAPRFRCGLDAPRSLSN